MWALKNTTRLLLLPKWNLGSSESCDVVANISLNIARHVVYRFLCIPQKHKSSIVVVLIGRFEIPESRYDVHYVLVNTLQLILSCVSYQICGFGNNSLLCLCHSCLSIQIPQCNKWVRQQWCTAGLCEGKSSKNFTFNRPSGWNDHILRSAGKCCSGDFFHSHFLMLPLTLFSLVTK